MSWNLDLGANFFPDGKVKYKVWAPHCKEVEVKIIRGIKTFTFPLRKIERSYFEGQMNVVAEGDLYQFILDRKKERPDPASRFQPKGVHGPSALVNPVSFKWRDRAWKGLPFEDLIFYEMHIGTFTPEGTFEGAVKKIPYLKKTGITCVEMMPIAQFPGKRNWGYDGVNLYAVQNSYGGPIGLKKFVAACHAEGLAVCLDVVYNHLGPEGNYLSDFGPYFTNRHHTPWGDAVNYDDKHSDEVRKFVIQNACYWVVEYHIDVLRLDAVHGIFDSSARHILEEINTTVQTLSRDLGRKVHLVAESDLNDPRTIRPKQKGGYGFAGQWCDDFHHAVHAILTHENNGYYQDFGRWADLGKALQKGFVYEGQYSEFRKRRHGCPTGNLSPEKLVVCTQNHDQIGNRPFGERLSALVPFEKLKLAAFMLWLTPYTPLLFMGEEYGERAPFQYFVDFEDPTLRKAVQEGRRREFASFGWEKIPDPCAPNAFLNSCLRWKEAQKRESVFLRRLYGDLMEFHKKFLMGQKISSVFADEAKNLLAFQYLPLKRKGLGVVWSLSEAEEGFNFNSKFSPLLTTDDSRYGGKNKLRIVQRKVVIPPLSAVIGRLD